MPILHTVNKSPFERGALESCLRHALAGSSVLLIEDAVYAVIEGTAAAALLSEAGSRLRLYALGPDLVARGIAPERHVRGVTVIDYAGFVNLAVECDKVQAWL